MNKENITAFLENFHDSITDDNKKLYQDIISNNKIADFTNYEEFYYGVIYPFNNFLDGYIVSEVSENNDVSFLLKNSHFIKNHFQGIINDKEGMACCADKSRTIMKALIEFYTTGKEIKFNYKGKYVFHLPTKIFINHSEIIDFYTALRSLFYGHNEKYLKFINDKVLKKQLGDSKKLYRNILDIYKTDKFTGYENFYYGVTHSFNHLSEEHIRNKICDNEYVVFILQNAFFVENHFQNIIRETEGIPCCVDKGRTIVTAIMTYYLTGKKIKFNDSDEYPHHNPSKIFTHHDEIIEFLDGLLYLLHGRSEKHLGFINNTVLKKQPDANKDFNDAIDFSITTDGGIDFLRCWREGDWQTIENEWPDFKISDQLKHPSF